MKKNNKGFTLIELLASIVILGILMLIAAPSVINMVTNNRNKMYVSDAQKLIAQAQYKMRSSSSNVEKPDVNNVILISLVFLDNGDFDSPPNEGEYLTESSYVVVKNNNGELEYSATLIEKMKKGGYKGVSLSTSSQLDASNSLTRVKVFEEDEVINVEDDLMTTSTLNNQLGTNYCNEIEGVYNYPDLADSAVKEINESPKIKKASLSSASNKSYGTFDAKLEIKAEDDTTTRSDLRIYYSTISYEDADRAENEHLYGTNDNYTAILDFSSLASNSYNGTVINLYVIVKDKEGYSTKKEFEYIIHQNQAPKITSENCSLTKRSTDNYNMTVATLKLVVTDDIDDNKDLKVCFSENENATTCDDYKPYSDYFGSGDTYTYKFKCNGTCSLDGSNVKLKVFVKDSENEVSTVTLNYQFYNNQAPEVNSIKIKSKSEEFIDNTDDVGSLRTTIYIDATDDLSTSDSVSVVINDGKQELQVSLTQCSNGLDFSLANTYKYDGSVVPFTITLTDEHGKSTVKNINYKLYENQKPVISKFKINSHGIACSGSESFCDGSDVGGNIATTVTLDLKDDIDYANDYGNLKVCMSLNESDCNDSKNYKLYSDMGDSFNYTFENGDYPYDGSTKRMYLYVKDSYNELTTSYFDYKLYKNQGIVLTNNTFDVLSNEEEFTTNGSLKVYISIDAKDDLVASERLSFTIEEVGTSNKKEYSYEQYVGKASSIPFTLTGVYDGTERTIRVTFTDSYGEVTTTDVKYTVYKNKSPDIESLTATSEGYACSNPTVCPLEEGGNKNLYVELTANDDIDYFVNVEDSKLKVCASLTKSDCTVDKVNTSNFVSYAKFNKNYVVDNSSYTGYKITIPITDNSGYDGSTKKIYVSVVDTYNAITTQVLEYKLYKSKGPVISTDYPQVSPLTDDDAALGAFKFDLLAYDDYTDQKDLKVKVCYITNKSDKEKCLTDGYVDYNLVDGSEEDVTRAYASYEFDLNLSKCTSTVYYVYAYVKDKDNNVTVISDKKNAPQYKSCTDNIPEIQSSSVESTDDEFNTKEVVVKFIVKDMYDTFSVCVSENSKNCSVYDHSFSGSDLEVHSVTYSGNDWNYNSNLKKKLYLFVKDTDESHDPVVSEAMEYTIYEACSELDYGSAYSTYTASGTKISASMCSGQCYYWPTEYSVDDDGNYLDENGKKTTDITKAKILRVGSINENISALYRRKISYHDRFTYSTLSTVCQDVVDEDYYAHCDFKDCYYNTKNKNYISKVIGITEVTENVVPFTVNYDDKTIECNSYYKEYITSYTDGDAEVTYNPTYNMICPELVDQYDLYAYDSTSDDPYLRRLDDDSPIEFPSS
jgi:prepilin-type N-terminal cleavage/methylation domain-containing protein